MALPSGQGLFFNHNPQATTVNGKTTDDTSDSLLGWLTGLGNTAANVIGSLKNENQRTATPTPAASQKPAWLMPAIYIGAAILAVVLLIPLFRK